MKKTIKLFKNALKKLLLSLIWVYQNGYSRYKSPCCRYIPSCSDYAVQAITKYGAIKGGYLTIKRLLRCNPWAKRGIYDPVP